MRMKPYTCDDCSLSFAAKSNLLHIGNTKSRNEYF